MATSPLSVKIRKIMHSSIRALFREYLFPTGWVGTLDRRFKGNDPNKNHARIILKKRLENRKKKYRGKAVKLKGYGFSKRIAPRK